MIEWAVVRRVHPTVPKFVVPGEQSVDTKSIASNSASSAVSSSFAWTNATAYPRACACLINSSWLPVRRPCCGCSNKRLAHTPACATPPACSMIRTGPLWVNKCREWTIRIRKVGWPGICTVEMYRTGSDRAWKNHRIHLKIWKNKSYTRSKEKFYGKKDHKSRVNRSVHWTHKKFEVLANGDKVHASQSTIVLQIGSLFTGNWTGNPIANML